MNLGLAQSSLAIAAGIVTVCTLSIAAVGSQISVADGSTVVIQPAPPQYVSISAATIFQDEADEGVGEVFDSPAEGEADFKAIKLAELRILLQEKRAKFGDRHPLIVGLQNEIEYLQQLPVSPTSLQIVTRKKSTETWQEYLNRLEERDLINQSQIETWLQGEQITLERQIPVQKFRVEKRTRTIPVNKTRKSTRADGTVVDIPYITHVTNKYDVQVPFTEMETVRMTIPKRGSQPEDASFTMGFKHAGSKNSEDSIRGGPPESKRQNVVDVMKIRPRQSDAVFQNYKKSDYDRLHVRSTNGVQPGEKILVKTDFETRIDNEKVGKVGKDTVHKVEAVHGYWCTLQGVKGWLPVGYVRRLNPKQDAVAGWELVDKQTGDTVRRFIDINGDEKLDNWIYFTNGFETYRDVDLDFNGKVDHSQYVEGDTIRYGIDENEDGKIDRWEKGTLSELKRN